MRGAVESWNLCKRRIKPNFPIRKMTQHRQGNEAGGIKMRARRKVEAAVSVTWARKAAPVSKV